MSLQDTLTPARVKRFLRLVSGKTNVVILTHNTPDPDSIGGALGLHHLIERRTKVGSRIAYGGTIGRVENQTMIRALGITMYPAGLIDFNTCDLAVLVDCRHGGENTPLPTDFTPYAEFDHHRESTSSGNEVFADVRMDYGATSTMITEYLRCTRTRVSAKLATALLYGIKVDTQNFNRLAGPADMQSYLYLFPRADKRLLAEIESPCRPRSYFASVRHAIERGRMFGPAVVIDLGEIPTEELVAEMADTFLRVKDVSYTMIFGRMDGELILSMRTCDPEGNVGRLVNKLVRPHGTAGGHAVMAGGRIMLDVRNPEKHYLAQVERMSRGLVHTLNLETEAVPLVEESAVPVLIGN